MNASRLELPPIERLVLPNGLVLIVAERHALPLVTLRLTLRAGGAQESPSENGVATLASRMVRRGAGARGAAEFAEALDHLGALLGTGTGLDHAALDAEFTTPTLEDGLELFLDALREPRFDVDEVDAERRRMMEEVVHARDDGEELADEAYLHELYREHPFGRCAVGSVAALERLDPARVQRFHERTWSPRGAVLTVVGDVDAPALAARLADELGSWRSDLPEPPRPPRPQPREGRPVVLVDLPGTSQVQLRLGQVGVTRDDPRWTALQVANAALGGGFSSRLVDRVRVEEGLTYSIGSRFYPGRLPGPFTISSFTESPNLARLHGLVTEILGEFKDSGPTQDEHEAARAWLGGLQPRRIETPGGLALALAEAELHGLGFDSLIDQRACLEAVTREEAAEAARSALPGEDLLTVLVGKAEELREAADPLGELEVLPWDFGERIGAADPEAD